VIVNIEDVEKWKKWKQEINRTKLENIEFREAGAKLYIDEEIINRWRFIGMTNLCFIETGYYKEGKCDSIKEIYFVKD
jgi:hypothetical protein